MRKVTQANYMKNPHYTRVVRAVNELLATSHVVAPVEVFVRMDLLSAADLESWRFGRVPYLERVIHCNLEKAERILRLLRLHAGARGLKPSYTAYRRWGKGARQALRFSKFGVPRLDELYSTHFVEINRKPFPSAASPGTQRAAIVEPTTAGAAAQDDDVWDQQIEIDATCGRLDRYAAEAIEELERGRTTET